MSICLFFLFMFSVLLVACRRKVSVFFCSSPYECERIYLLGEIDPGTDFINVDGLSPYRAVSWNAAPLSPIFAAELPITSEPALIVLRKLQARLIHHQKVPLIEPSVFGMQDQVFRAHEWGLIIGSWIRDAMFNCQEYQDFLKFVCFMGADNIMLSLIQKGAGDSYYMYCDAA